ncbi:hypothetical protein BJ912DRAFT_1008154 [Pholiota molesta]|nr:hypothetical protein BJ912DRAFT_1008154 [Pholiota molesta]
MYATPTLQSLLASTLGLGFLHTRDVLLAFQLILPVLGLLEVDETKNARRACSACSCHCVGSSASRAGLIRLVGSYIARAFVPGIPAFLVLATYILSNCVARSSLYSTTRHSFL